MTEFVRPKTKQNAIKLSNKFEGSMLESRIVNRLINLGYELPMIREVINEEESKND